MTEAYYIRITQDPWAKHESRGYSRHNMYSLVNKVFRVVSPIPQDEEIVSLIDGSTTTYKCYLIEVDEFVRVVPQFEDNPHYEAMRSAKTVAIPVDFAVPWIPEGRIIDGQSCGLEEGVRKSKRWVEEAKKLGISTENPFTLKTWV